IQAAQLEFSVNNVDLGCWRSPRGGITWADALLRAAAPAICPACGAGMCRNRGAQPIWSELSSLCRGAAGPPWVLSNSRRQQFVELLVGKASARALWPACGLPEQRQPCRAMPE